jgi:hypothetical protein
MRGVSVLVVAATIAVGSLWIGSAIAAPASTSAGSAGPCTVTAIRWTQAGQSGTMYVIRLRGPVTCGFAKTWVPRVARQHAIQIGGPGNVKGGPPGWTCRSLGLRYSGTCYLTSNPGQAFAWVPKTR